jgi:hypothetical protein
VSSLSLTRPRREDRRRGVYTISGGDFGRRFEISGGAQKDLRGMYNQMGESRTCAGKPVYSYTHDCGWFCSDTTYYLYQPEESSGMPQWVVGDEDDMNGCKDRGNLHSTGDCADDPSGSGCKWMAHTGKNTDYAECNTHWCSEPGLTVRCYYSHLKVRCGT